MQLVITAGDRQWEEIKPAQSTANWVRVDSPAGFSAYPDAAAFFDLRDTVGDMVYPVSDRPVFINSTETTLQEMNMAPNILRINGWPGFISRPVWDVAGTFPCEEILQHIGKKKAAAPDQPGLIAARIIAMIINEAFFTVGDDVSSREETDTAMKLGTNYPYGPFEWCAAIGEKRVLSLLEKLASADPRYTPAPLLAATIQTTGS